MKNRLISIVLSLLFILTSMPIINVSANTSTLQSCQALDPADILGFEKWFQGATVCGVIRTPDDTFDNLPVMSLSVEDGVDESYLSDDYGEVYTGYYEMNLFSYGLETDSTGQRIPLHGSKYITYDYYYQTDRADYIGNDISFRLQSYIDSTGTSKYDRTIQVNSAQKLNANKWQRVTFCLVDENNSDLFSYENLDNYSVGQWKLYPFGTDSGITLKAGEALYVRSIKFYSYDPVVDETGYNVTIYSDNDCQEIVNSSTNLSIYDTFTFPEPDYSLAPEGSTFNGYIDADSNKVFDAGDSFQITSETKDYKFYQDFSSELKTYVSTDGVIDGVHVKVYTTLADADKAIAKTTKSGIIYIEGEVPLSDGFAFSSDNLKIMSYNADPESGSILFNDNPEGYVTPFISGAPTSIVLDNLTISRGSSLVADEMFIHFDNIDITFGKNCQYNSGIRESDSKILNLYIGQHRSSSNGNTITFDSPNVVTQILAPNGGWDGTNTYSGSFKYVINNGTFDEVHAVTRDTGPNAYSTVSGTVELDINGGTIRNLCVGSLRNAKLDGSAIVTINGGKFDDVVFGPLSFSEKVPEAYYHNLALVLNLKDLIYSGSAIPNIKESEYDYGSNNTVYIVNNSEYGGYTTLNTKYQLFVQNGKAEPVFDENDVKFKIVSDNEARPYPYANGNPLPCENGLYTVPEGSNEIEFRSSNKKVTVSFKSESQTIDKLYFPGQEIILENLFDENNDAIFVGYEYNGKTLAEGTKFVVPGNDVVLTPIYLNKNAVYYISSSGSDNNSGNSPDAPLASFSKFYSLVGNNSSTIVVMDLVEDWPYTAYTDKNNNEIRLAENQVITVTGKDPLTYVIYPNAAICRGEDRPNLYSGTLVLSHIADKNHISSAVNTPIAVGGNATLTLDKGYTYSSTTASIGTQVKIMPNGQAANPVFNINGALQVFNLIDWQNTSADTVTVNIGADATVKSSINIGGDSGFGMTGTICSTTVNKMFVNIDSCISENVVRIGGDNGSNVKINEGIQLLFKNTNMGYSRYTYSDESSASYKGAKEYIISVTNAKNGCDVISSELGKINIIIPEGYKALVSTDSKTETILDSCEYTISEGATNISFRQSLVNDITWYVDENGILFISGDGDIPVYTPTTSPWYEYREQINQVIISPGIKNIGNYSFAGLIYLTDVLIPTSVENIGASVFYDCSNFNIHCYADSFANSYCTANSLPCKIIPDNTVFVNSASNIGNGTIEFPFQTIGAAIDAHNNNDGTIYIIGKYDISGFTHNKWDGMITFTGSGKSSEIVLTKSKDVYLRGDSTFKDITLDIGEFSHFDSENATLIMDAGENTYFDAYIHMGNYGNRVVDYANYIQNSGNISDLFLGGAYTTTTSSGIYGDVNATINNGEVEKIILSTDKFLDVHSGISIGGNVNITINGGTVKEITYSNDTASDIMGSVNIIFNNDAYATSIISTPPTVCGGTYIIKNGIGGTITPTSVDGVFELDANAGMVAVINGKKYADGEVKLPEGKTTISWIKGTQPEYTNWEIQSMIAFGTCGDNAEWSLSPDGVLKITGTGDMDDWYLDNQPWFQYASVIKNVVISEGITSIGNHAFRYCTALEEVSLPTTLTSIGDEAFTVCFSLKEVTLPDNLEYIGTGSFYECSSLESIVIPDKVSYIGPGAFFECVALKTVLVPESVDEIGTNAFRNSINLSSVLICGNNCNISENAFEGCGNVIITSLQGSFAETYAASNGIKFTGINNIYRCGQSGETVWCLDGSGNMTISGAGIIPDYLASGTPWNTYSNQITSITIADGVTEIGNNAFYELTNVTTVSIPESITRIGTSTFFGCSRLSSIKIPKNVTTLEKYCFSRCTSLANVTLGSGVKSIDNYAFRECIMLKTINIPANAKSIGSYAFQNCSSLEALIISQNVSSIGPFAFDGCSKLVISTPQNSYTQNYCASNNINYKEAENIVVTFDTCGGSLVEQSMLKVAYGDAYGSLPVPVYDGYTFTGWYTEIIGGTKIEPEMLVNTSTNHTLYAHWKPIIKISIGDATVKNADTFTIPVTITGNTGIAGLTLKLSYPTQFTLQSVTKGTALNELAFTYSNDLSVSPITFIWDGENDDLSNGTILELTFTTPENVTDGNYTIDLLYDSEDIHDAKLETLDVSVESGNITVVTRTPGDVNNDGKINSNDVTLIRRHIVGGYGVSINEAAADVNADGKVNSNDITLIRRYIVGGYGVTLK